MTVVVDSALSFLRGDTLSQAIAGLGDLTGYSKIWFTAKAGRADRDRAARIQVEIADGLLRINGKAPASADNGSIVISDLTDGDIVVTVAAVEMAKVEPFTGVWDVQALLGTTLVTLGAGMCDVSGDATRATS